MQSNIINLFANSDPERSPQDLVISLIRKTREDIRHLSEEEGSFLRKFEKILRILYRSNCCNSELIVRYQELSIHDNSEEEDRVQFEFHELVSQAKDLLKDQARRDGFMNGNKGMDQLILFMLGEVLKLYQEELLSCCRNFVEEGCNFPFPCEEDMVSHYYQPIAEQLKGLIAS
ncbi:MAG: hypothetical protein B6241_08145 [Spirochaetaceae bacterium 4572_59]|nr:MAG: hypothetical protein B6241_08145 [Spirochaetaceae bacterium 4572_59]